MAIAFAALLGTFLGFVAASTPSRQDGMVLLAKIVFAFFVAGVSGALTPFVPAALSIWLTRLDVFCILFIIGVCAGREP